MAAAVLALISALQGSKAASYFWQCCKKRKKEDKTKDAEAAAGAAEEESSGGAAEDALQLRAPRSPRSPKSLYSTMPKKTRFGATDVRGDFLEDTYQLNTLGSPCEAVDPEVQNSVYKLYPSLRPKVVKPVIKLPLELCQGRYDMHLMTRKRPCPAPLTSKFVTIPDTLVISGRDYSLHNANINGIYRVLETKHHRRPAYGKVAGPTAEAATLTNVVPRTIYLYFHDLAASWFLGYKLGETKGALARAFGTDRDTPDCLHPWEFFSGEGWEEDIEVYCIKAGPEHDRSIVKPSQAR